MWFRLRKRSVSVSCLICCFLLINCKTPFQVEEAKLQRIANGSRWESKSYVRCDHHRLRWSSNDDHRPIVSSETGKWRAVVEAWDRKDEGVWSESESFSLYSSAEVWKSRRRIETQRCGEWKRTWPAEREGNVLQIFIYFVTQFDIMGLYYKGEIWATVIRSKLVLLDLCVIYFTQKLKRK